MGCHHNSTAARGNFAQNGVEHLTGILVETRVRLIEKHHFGVVQYGPSDG